MGLVGLILTSGSGGTGNLGRGGELRSWGFRLGPLLAVGQTGLFVLSSFLFFFFEAVSPARPRGAGLGCTIGNFSGVGGRRGKRVGPWESGLWLFGRLGAGAEAGFLRRGRWLKRVGGFSRGRAVSGSAPASSTVPLGAEGRVSRGF